MFVVALFIHFFIVNTNKVVDFLFNREGTADDLGKRADNFTLFLRCLTREILNFFFFFDEIGANTIDKGFLLIRDLFETS